MSTKYLFYGKVSSIFNGKKTKTEGKFKNRKNLKKRYLVSLRIELRSFIMAEVGNYLKNIYNKKMLFAFIETWTQDLL